MSDEKKKFPKFTTPRGVMVFPWLNKPDTKFKAVGEYKVQLRLAESDPKTQELIGKLQPLWDQSVADAKAAFAKNPKNKGKKLATIWELFKKVFDDDGNETGEIEFTFKRTASGVSKKKGTPWAVKPDLFDARGDKLAPETRIFGGSEGKVSFEAMPYDTPTGIGLSLRLMGVQVIKLVDGQRNAASHGFGDESEDDESSDADNSEAGEDAGEGGQGDDF